MKEIKRCPFCGGEAEIRPTDYFETWYVMCQKCLARTRAFSLERNAIIIWNNRKPMESILERLNNRLMTAVDCANIYSNPTYDVIIECCEEAIEIVKEEGDCIGYSKNCSDGFLD